MENENFVRTLNETENIRGLAEEELYARFLTFGGAFS